MNLPPGNRGIVGKRVHGKQPTDDGTPIPEAGLLWSL
jgi:hypothetical protein